jgi:hypothetical protein
MNWGETPYAIKDFHSKSFSIAIFFHITAIAWLRKDLAMLPPDAELIEELLAFSYEVKNGKVKVSSTDDIKALLKRSPDRARSLMLTFTLSLNTGDGLKVTTRLGSSIRF